MKAKYTYEYIDDVLVIVDQLGPRSVTNDIENILRVIHANEAADLTGKKIIYRDSGSKWDGLIAKNTGNYQRPIYAVDFLPMQHESQKQAIFLINNYYANEKVD